MDNNERPSSSSSTEQDPKVISSVTKLLETSEEILKNSSHLWHEARALFSLELQLAKHGLVSIILSLIMLVFVILAALFSLELLIILGLRTAGLDWIWAVAIVFLLNLFLIDRMIRRLRRAKKDMGFYRLRALWKGLKS